MNKHTLVEAEVKKLYEESTQDFGQWMWKHHVPHVAQKAEELCKRFNADPDLAVTGAWLHDVGDAVVHRFDPTHNQVTDEVSIKILETAGYSPEQIQIILKDVIAPHSCRDGYCPLNLEGKVLATADALAHLETDFYLQFCWKHLPEGKDYEQFKHWVYVKADRDFNAKIFFAEIKDEVEYRYKAIRTLFA